MSLVITHSLSRSIFVASLPPTELYLVAEITAVLTDFWGASFEAQRNTLYSADRYLSPVAEVNTQILDNVRQMAARWESQGEPTASDSFTVSGLIMEWGRLKDQVTEQPGEASQRASSSYSFRGEPRSAPRRRPSSTAMPRVAPLARSDEPPEGVGLPAPRRPSRTMAAVRPQPSVAHPIPAPDSGRPTVATVMTERAMEREAERHVDNLNAWLGTFAKLMTTDTANQLDVQKYVDLLEEVVTSMADLQTQGDRLGTLFWEGVLAVAEIQALFSGLARMDAQTAIRSEEHVAKWNHFVADFNAAISRTRGQSVDPGR